jgi:hypothetical protein
MFQLRQEVTSKPPNIVFHGGQVSREAVAVAGHRMVHDQQLVRISWNELGLQRDAVQRRKKDIFIVEPNIAGTFQDRRTDAGLEELGVLLDHRMKLVRD